MSRIAAGNKMDKSEQYYRQKTIELSEALSDLIAAVNRTIKNHPFELSEALFKAEELLGWQD